MRFVCLTLSFLLAFAPPALARGLDKSPRPLARGTVADVVVAKVRPQMRPSAQSNERPSAAPDAAAALTVLALPNRPRLRPASEQEIAMAQLGETVVLASASAVLVGQSLHPVLRPAGLEKKAMAKRQQIQRGAICGDPELQGDVVGAVAGKIRGCGVENAIRLKSVSGVRLSQSAVIDCTTAKALKTWVNKGMKPAIGTRGGGVQTIKVAAHYACRTRNNQPGARISEHGRGRAIDISGFTLQDGSKINLLDGWRSSKDGPALKKMHKAACGPFGTVLGPNSNRFHQDHFHFDTARYRSGSYCR